MTVICALAACKAVLLRLCTKLSAGAERDFDMGGKREVPTGIFKLNCAAVCLRHTALRAHAEAARIWHAGRLGLSKSLRELEKARSSPGF